jgi:DNA (cytosine-5)-methyltransferase 1
MIYRLAELFCGAGGLALGAEMATINNNGEEYSCQHVWVNDFNEWACKTFEHNLCRNHPTEIVCGDIRKVDLNNVPEIDGLAFGFPCNDYSLVGERKGLQGEYGPLYSYGVHILNTRNPQFFIAENVSGLSSANDGKAFRNILSDMQKAGEVGYSLTPHLYKFEQYGIPQMRHRILIVGIRKDLGVKFKVPITTHSTYRTVSEALNGVENVQYNNERTAHKKSVIEMLNHIPPGGNAWHSDIPEELRLNVKKFKASQIYRRLHPAKPSYTITGSGGGGTHGYHWDEPRALTNRERARIQTFPDWFEFIGPKEQVRKQIGMAVPPDGVKVVFEHIIKTLLGIEYEWEQEKWDVPDNEIDNIALDI